MFIEKHRTVIKEIEKEILEQPSLTIPDFSKPFDLYADASHLACSAILKQENKLIGFYSYKLKTSEIKTIQFAKKNFLQYSEQ